MGKGIALEIAAAADVGYVSGRPASAGGSGTLLAGTIDHTAHAINVSGTPPFQFLADHSHERANLMLGYSAWSICGQLNLLVNSAIFSTPDQLFFNIWSTASISSS